MVLHICDPKMFKSVWYCLTQISPEPKRQAKASATSSNSQTLAKSNSDPYGHVDYLSINHSPHYKEIAIHDENLTLKLKKQPSRDQDWLKGL